MTKEKKDWDDIPSLEGLEVEWDFEPGNPHGKRAFERMKGEELAPLFKMQEIPVEVSANIPVRVATAKAQFQGIVFDICQGGLGIDSVPELFENQVVKVGFFLGKKKIISKAVVKWAVKKDTFYRSGLMFVELDQEANDFIAGVYASKQFNKV